MTSRRMTALVGLLGAALIVSLGLAGDADSKRFGKKVIKSVSKKRLAGAYRGVTEQGTAVSFRLTRGGKIVDFVIPVTLSCETDVGDLDGDGTSGTQADEYSVKAKLRRELRTTSPGRFRRRPRQWRERSSCSGETAPSITRPAVSAAP